MSALPTSGGLAAVRREVGVPSVIADEQGLIIDVNDRFQTELGWSRRQLVGEPLSTIIPERFRDAHHVGFSRFLATGVATLLDRPLTLAVLTAGGHELQAEHVITAERVEGRWLFGATIRPLTPEDGGGD